jgi:hypothetical protein
MFAFDSLEYAFNDSVAAVSQKLKREVAFRANQ